MEKGYRRKKCPLFLVKLLKSLEPKGKTEKKRESNVSEVSLEAGLCTLPSGLAASVPEEDHRHPTLNLGDLRVRRNRPHDPSLLEFSLTADLSLLSQHAG